MSPPLQPVIRSKFADMFAKVEATQALLEHITYQMCSMNYAEQSDLLAGPIGLLKMQCTRVAGEIATQCTQIFGGRSVTSSGMGKNVEGFQRTQAFDSILGGAEDGKTLPPTISVFDDSMDRLLTIL